jgi:PAS domain S-box-containing protein
MMQMPQTPRKKRFFKLSLREILFAGAGLGILLPALALALFQISSKQESDIQLRLRAPMQQQAGVLARSLGLAIWNVDHRAAEELLDAVMLNPDVVRIEIKDEFDGIFVAQEKSARQGDHLLVENSQILHEGNRVGKLQIVLTTARIQRELRADLVQMGLALAAQVGISFGLIWFLFERRLVRPITELQTQTQRLTQGELDKPIRWTRGDEIGSLAQGLESMRSDLVLSIAERDKKTHALQDELTERQRMEEALGVSQAKFEAIFHASPVAMTVSIMTDKVTLLDVNAAWLTMMQCERETVLGTTQSTRAFWKNPQDHQQVLRAMQAHGAMHRLKFEMLPHQASAPILCEVSGSKVKTGETGDQSMLILAYQDITAQHQAEQEIQQLNTTLEQRVESHTQELTNTLHQLKVTQAELVRTEKMSALGALVAGVAHELNTPIGNSLTVASTLQDNSASFATDMGKGMTRKRLEEFVQSNQQGSQILVRSLQHAAELVSSFKQVAVDQTSVNRRVFGLKETLHEMLLTLGPSLRKNQYKVQSEIPENITLDSYPGPLGQIVTNLINNAFLHAFENIEHGTVLISARTVADDAVEITVRDNGCGIPVAHLDKVFDPFFTTKLGQGGSGLGLNIVYNLVTTTLGGRIQVNSQMGAGTQFTITLPLRVA